MVIETALNFYNYSEDSLEQVIDQSIGKPFFDENRNQIGKIIHAKRVDDSTTIEFEIDTEVIG